MGYEGTSLGGAHNAKTTSLDTWITSSGHWYEWDFCPLWSIRIWNSVMEGDLTWGWWTHNTEKEKRSQSSDHPMLEPGCSRGHAVSPGKCPLTGCVQPLQPLSLTAAPNFPPGMPLATGTFCQILALLASWSPSLRDTCVYSVSLLGMSPLINLTLWKDTNVCEWLF